MLEDVDLLVVVGTPRPNEHAFIKRALQLYGSAILQSIPDPGFVARRTTGWHDGKYVELEVKIANSRGADARWEQAEDAIVGQELLHALGRSRAVHGGKIVIVMTNWPIEYSAKHF